MMSPANSPAMESSAVAAAALLPVTVITDARPDEWDAFVDGHPDGTIEHRAAWRQVFQRAFGHDCVYLSARRSGTIVGVLPLVRYKSLLFGRFVVSLPYFNYAGIVADDQLVVDALVREAERIGREHGASYLEFRHRRRQVAASTARENKVGFHRELPSTSEALWSAIDRKVRNQVRKAQKENLAVVAGDVELAGEFYAVFAENMRDLGTPVFPLALFTEAAAAFGPACKFFVVRSGAVPVAGGIALTFRDTVLVPWASSLRAYRQHCPNMLLYWAMMDWSVAQGAKIFDFGRSTVGAGTQQFKEQWGGVPRQLYTEYVMLEDREAPDHGAGSEKMQFAVSMWQRLPLSVATRLGPKIIRHVA
jgi:FemAB-related protein (PEP-CTERM system-associated)